MNLLVAPAPSRRRKSASDIYRGMTLSKACAILGISEKEFRELTEVGLRAAFTRRVERDESKTGVGLEAALDNQMKLHEAFQYIVRRREASQAEKQRKFSDKTSCPEWVPAGSQDLGSLEDLTCDLNSKSMKNDVDSTPYMTRDYVISPFEVGPGTPPPIEIPGLDLSGISWGRKDDIPGPNEDEEKLDVSEQMQSLPTVVVQEKTSSHKKSRLR